MNWQHYCHVSCHTLLCYLLHLIFTQTCVLLHCTNLLLRVKFSWMGLFFFSSSQLPLVHSGPIPALGHWSPCVKTSLSWYVCIAIDRWMYALFCYSGQAGPKTPLFPVCLVETRFLPIFNVNSGKCSLSTQSTITQVLNFALTSPVKSNLPAHITQPFQWRS